MLFHKNFAKIHRCPKKKLMQHLKITTVLIMSLSLKLYIAIETLTIIAILKDLLF